MRPLGHAGSSPLLGQHHPNFLLFSPSHVTLAFVPIHTGLSNTATGKPALLTEQPTK